MEHKGYGRWKSRIPAYICSGHTRPLTHGDGLSPLHGQDAKDSERSVIKKTVTLAPTSRYMTGRTYTARKPAITAERKISILKKPLTQECSDMVHKSSVASYQEESEGLLYKSSDKHTEENTIISQTSFPSVSREDHYASLSVSDLKLHSSPAEHNFSSLLSDCKYEGRSLSTPPLDDLSLTVPLNPKWTSTQKFSRFCSTQINSPPKTITGESEQERDSVLNTHSSLSYSKDSSSSIKYMSPYQANYWACVIPSSLPPSPNRKSSSWDPDKEYQELLDYTYPLRPNITNNWGLSECRPLLQNDQFLQDSGIELDHTCSSSSLSLGKIKTRQDGGCPGQRLSELQSQNLRKHSPSKFSDGRISNSLYSSLSVESLDFEGKKNFYYRKFGIFCTSRSSPNFIRSTYILPHHGSLGELDEDFLRLPEQLKELQDLSDELKDITAQISQPVTTNWESLERESAPIRSLATQIHKYTPMIIVQEKDGEEDHRSVSKLPLQREKFSEQVTGLGARVQTISSQVNRDNLRDVEAIMDQLSGTSTSEFQSKTGSEENKKSLLQHIQAFCSNLEELIQWLYTVVEKMEVLSPPSVNIESVKASLADYKSFQKEVQAHRPLTASVLQTGEMLLCCMNSASPFLQETLKLIERQSCALEAHSEHLFSSILSAMDTLTEPNMQEDTEKAS